MTRDIFGRSIPEDFRIAFRRDVLAEALWEYGEAELAEAALGLSEHDLHQGHPARADLSRVDVGSFLG